MLRWIIFCVFYLVLGFYALQAIKTASRFPWVYSIFILLSLLVLGNFIYQFSFGEEEGRVLSRVKSYAFGFLLVDSSHKRNDSLIVDCVSKNFIRC